MDKTTGRLLNLKRAIGTFFMAYIAITILATAFCMLIAVLLHTPATSSPVNSPAYRLAEKFLPLLNLLVWMAFAWFYFKQPAQPIASWKEPVALGGLWFVITVPVDFVAFVLIKNPISLTPNEFYVGQFPWIYLIYVAVFVSPISLCILRGDLNHN